MSMIVYCHSLPVPNAVTLYPDDSTESSVSASWTKPDGKVQRYEISCETGYPVPDCNRRDWSRQTRGILCGVTKCGKQLCHDCLFHCGKQTKFVHNSTSYRFE